MNTLFNPAPWQTIPQMLQENCFRYRDLNAVLDGDIKFTYRELAAAVKQYANAMINQGVKIGEPIAIWAPNSWQWVICAFACWTAGAVVVPISSRLKALEAGPILSRSGTRMLFTVSDCGGVDLPELLAVTYGAHSVRPFDQLPRLEQVICFDSASKVGACNTFENFIDSSTDSDTDVSNRTISSESLGEILFTSGTTGEPKGVMLTQQQVLQAFWDWSDIGGLNERDRFLVIPPFSHGFGINAGILACAMRGMTHVVVDFFNPEKALELIKKHSISVMSGPPALFASLAQELAADQNANQQANTLRVAYVGAAHVPEEMIISMQDKLGIDRVINAYGLIEACAVTMTRSDDSNTIISTSVGRPLPNVEIKIVDDNNQQLPEDQPGEILVRGYGVMQGYFEAPELTDATIDSDLWLHTGDIGTVDAEGNLTIVGRKKELFICNGFNVYPAEVEDLLLQHPSINQAAVVGIEHPNKGEVGAAFVIPVANAAAFDQDALIAWAKRNMASYKVPAHIFPLEQFPLNANGKVRRDELIAHAQQHTRTEQIGA